MSQELNTLLIEVEAAENSGSANFIASYEDSLAERITVEGARFLDNLTAPSIEDVRKWLQILSHVSDFSIEGPPDIAVGLHQKYPEIFHDAILGMHQNEAAKIQDFISSLGDQSQLDDQDIPALQLNEVEAAALRGAGPLLARFAIFQQNDGRRKVWKGKLYLNDLAGNEVLAQEARTGGFVPSYKSKNGPTPPGTYIVSHYRSDRSGTPGMTLHGISFSFDLSDPVLAPHRSALRIHPDQAPNGTHGCIGVWAENATELKGVADTIHSVLQQAGGRFQLVVEYGTGGGDA